MKATKKEAENDIRWRDFESIIFPPTKNHKNRNCLFCEKNIKGGEQYFKHFEYTYEANQKRWNACIDCFNKIYEEMPPLNPMCKKHKYVFQIRGFRYLLKEYPRPQFACINCGVNQKFDKSREV